MKSLSVKKGCLHSTVSLPASKSYANRALILCSLLKKSPALKNIPDATDVSLLIEGLKKAGLVFEKKGDALHCLNSFPDCEEEGNEIETGEGGTTARFLAAMLLLGKKQYRLKLGQRLKDRPWQEFIELARKLGARADLEGSVLTLQGPIQLPRKLEIDCSKTTQFATAFHLLTICHSFEVVPVNLTSSQSYWSMTEKLVSELGSLDCYEIPMDWSSASYPMAFAALNQKIFFPSLRADPFQADAKFLDVLKSFGCVLERDNGLTVTPVTEFCSLTLNVSDCLDLVPTLVYFLAHIEGQHVLEGVENLRHKESDRLEEGLKLLKTFDRKASYEAGRFFIEGKNAPLAKAVKLQMPDDHRMVMAGTLFLLHHYGGQIGPVEAVDKSFPGFFSLIAP